MTSEISAAKSGLMGPCFLVMKDSKGGNTIV